MSTGSIPVPPPRVGLCETCANVKIVETRRGSRFYLCRLSEVDARFPKYPPLPVVRCLGYVRSVDGELQEPPAEAGE